MWLELVPATALRAVAFTPHLARWEIGIAGWVDRIPTDQCRLSVTLTSRGTLLAADTYTVVAGEVHRRIALSYPGIDDSRNELLWSPDAPTRLSPYFVEFVSVAGTTIPRSATREVAPFR